MDEKIQAKLDALKISYTQNLPGKLTDIEKRWHVLSRHFDKQPFHDFHREVHSLAGSAGTYGFRALGQACRDLDIYLKQLLDYTHLDAIQKSEIAHLIECIKDTQPANHEARLDLSNRAVSSRLIIYLIDKKNKFNIELKKNLSHLGYELLFLRTVEQFKELINQQVPAAIILDECHLNETMSQALIHSCSYQIPILCLATNDDLYTRLRAIRAGVSVFLLQPVEIFHLINQLAQLCDVSTRADYRILILDDSVDLASYYTLVLQEAGMNVRAIHSPVELMHELQDFKPNLLLLDLYLPECTGFDIAKIIRLEECYMSVPIIFISTENDRIKQLAILNSCGADDFLTKPVLPQNLVSAVKSRAQRASLLNSYIALDSLTKLLNHTYILKQLEFEILRAERFNQPIAVAMVDLDYFKQINDKYGHPVGDLVLKKMAELFLSRVRKTDFVGRYGGEEFSIIFPNTNQSTALTLCQKLCKKISEHPFHVSGVTFHVTLSIGIACYPGYVTVDALVAAADRALYVAKSNGRNRVDLASF